MRIEQNILAFALSMWHITNSNSLEYHLFLTTEKEWTLNETRLGIIGFFFHFMIFIAILYTITNVLECIVVNLVRLFLI